MQLWVVKIGWNTKIIDSGMETEGRGICHVEWYRGQQPHMETATKLCENDIIENVLVAVVLRILRLVDVCCKYLLISIYSWFNQRFLSLLLSEKIFSSFSTYIMHHWILTTFLTSLSYFLLYKEFLDYMILDAQHSIVTVLCSNNSRFCKTTCIMDCILQDVHFS